MGWRIRKSWTSGGTRTTISRRGLTVSQQLGPITITTNGHVYLRILPGIGYQMRIW